MSNPILEEVFRNRDQLWKECGGDVDVLLDRAEKTAQELGFTTVPPKESKKRSKPKKVLAKQHSRPAKPKKRTKVTKN